MQWNVIILQQYFTTKWFVCIYYTVDVRIRDKPEVRLKQDKLNICNNFKLIWTKGQTFVSNVHNEINRQTKKVHS